MHHTQGLIPFFGHSFSTGHWEQLGFGLHFCLPRLLTVSLSLFQYFSGIRSFISLAALFLSWVSVSPRRKAVRSKWVSTTTAFFFKTLCRYQEAVFSPTPGSFTSSSRVSGIPFSATISERALIFLAFALNRPEE